MKTLAKLTLIAALLTTAAAAQAEWVRGYWRNNGTYVAPHYRTPASGIPYDNLGYRPIPLPYYPSYSNPVTICGSSLQIGGVTFHNYYSSDGGSLIGNTVSIGNMTTTFLTTW